ncbi:MAG: hypothetical protein UR28_C0001G0004 [Candidatus Peregrinibacteria bacterium GW2011_GWF2_33_10]|nr:MAG: hypothetical protein UR28_C0001G0004 [Candidatus Peregrinibacteria bacterium GW2011_GWF2_33_10]OGJ44010.1 MAG: hypothetical protein A2263_01345 [Candidatus Peregrinibacteria bacterium RIFOXYA2_FULL_33_21]OGJ47173.1 MAG: hypothetical protein A2272_05845 [Candidatus Peregrinibacteria bacterium RIFOXYA12_FULL_33_12]OGJ49907.1 MAG: hypothetical protein A2307_00855 [Candidatus Peregrinibacteria bacterium RIFOXYB2_FULL_33_20]
MLHLEIFNAKRKNAFETLNKHDLGFVLGGGTAIALQLGHRISYDFDFFSDKPIKKNLLNKCKEFLKIEKILIDTIDELTFTDSNGIKFTFLYYPFKNLYKSIDTKGCVQFFDLKDLACDKAHTIGRRAQYRDYVDLYFLIKNGVDFKKLINDSIKKFTNSFNTKLFFGQLTYLDDLKDIGEIKFLDNKEITKNDIECFFNDLVAKNIDL